MKYDSYIQQAYRQIAYHILYDVQQNGFLGGSYIMLTFETNRDDVILPDFVKAKYPTEITIVLQHQYENLNVTPDKIAVDLAFGGVLSTIEIPFIALKTIADPVQEFGLIFEPEANEKTTAEKTSSCDKVIDLSAYRKN